MAAPVRVPRTAWVEAALQRLADGGPDAVRIEPLARLLGVTRGSFYWHFGDRASLLAAMLDYWERAATDDVIERVEQGGVAARTRLRRAGALSFSAALLPVDLAVREWSRHDEAVAERLGRVDNRRMTYLRTLFGALSSDEAEIEARSVLAFSLMIGNHLMMVDYGIRSQEESLALAAEWLLR